MRIVIDWIGASLRRAVCFFFLGLLLMRPIIAQAQGIDGCSGRLADSHWLVVDCSPGFATSHDQISIYLRDGSDGKKTWRENLNFMNSIWIFDAGATGRAALIINFHRDGNALVADLFDDGNGDGKVDYVRDRNEPVITENRGHWTVRFIAPEGEWTHNGITNFNLDVLVDGPPQGMIDNFTYVNLLKTDGTVDLEIHVRDADGDGRPDYEWRQAYPPLPESSGYYRTAIMVDTRGNEPPMTGSIFWPFLTSDSRVGFIRPFGAKNNPAPVQVDWKKARILSLGEFVASRGKPGNYFIYSISRVGPGNGDLADFENPFAFYDLAQANDGWPDLSVRALHYPRKDLYPDLGQSYVPGGQPIPVTQVLYTWDQYHRQQWDYEVSVAGFYDYDQRIKFPGFSVVSVPPDQLPTWVTSRSWDAATFVQVEKNAYWNNEHIYEWSTETAAGKLWRYLFGKDLVAPGQAYENIPPGFRGEYTLNLQSQPYLYFSPIDHKLHLQKATAGVWNIDGQSEVRALNLNQDNYLDTWLYLENTVVQRQLMQTSDYLVYAGEGEVLLRRAQINPSLFMVLPPTNHAEWADLRSKLESNKPDFAPDDFKTMMEQFAGPETRISAASLRDYRRTDNRGFRFVLDLKSSFQVQGPDLLTFGALKPGTYVVTYDGAFKVQTLTPPSLSVTLLNAKLTRLEPGTIQVSVRNSGLEDVPEATLELWATSPAEITKVVATQQVQLLAQNPVILNLLWAPPSSGAWVLTPKIRQADGYLISGHPTSIEVAQSENKNPLRLLLVSAPQTRLPILVIGLILLTMPIALVFWHEWAKPLLQKENYEAESLNLDEKKNKELSCPDCQAREKQRKAGFNHSGSQRYRCGDCKRVYTPNPRPHGYSVEIRMLAISMYQGGNSYKAISRVLNVSPQSVANWTKQHASQVLVSTDFSRPDGAVAYSFLVEKNESYLRESE